MKISSVIKYLIAFDFAVLTACGLIVPIFAIFITDKIEGGSVKVAGFASAVYMASFSVSRLLSAYSVDKRLNEKQGIALSIFGTILISIVCFSY